MVKRTDEILDTKAGDMLLDLNASDEEKTIEGLLRLERHYIASDNQTVSWRAHPEVFKWAKTVAMQESLKQGKDIHYQKLVMGCFLDKYPLPKK